MAPAIKTEALQLIKTTDNEQLLQLPKVSLEYFSQTGYDITGNLQPDDKKELEALADEPDADNTLTEQEFINATTQWSTQQFINNCLLYFFILKSNGMKMLQNNLLRSLKNRYL